MTSVTRPPLEAQAASDIDALVDTYCRGWSDPDPGVRLACLREALTPDARYTDPRADTGSIDELAAHIARMHETRPGARVLRTSRVDVHHGLGRFHWHAVLADGTVLPEGIDVIELDADGRRIRRIVGFFGPLLATTN